VLLGATEVTFTSTTTYEVALTISHAGSPGVTCTRTDTGTYALAFPTAEDQFITISPQLGATFADARFISIDLSAGTAAFETFTDDAGTARRDDLNLTEASFVVEFRAFTLGTNA
jgi:hypothetical protein